MLSELGGLLGGALGQVGDALSAPRRAIWSAIGLPESGSDLVANTLGMDKDSPWTHALGMGAEILGDPLTYAGGLAGKAASWLGRGASEAAAGAKAMSPLRRTFGMVKNARAIPEELMPLAREATAAGSVPARTVATDILKIPDALGSAEPLAYVGQLTGRASMNDARRALEAVGPDIASGDMAGAFFPRMNVGVSSGVTNNRHELVHGLINAAAQHPDDAAALPLAMRLPAALQRAAGTDNPFLKGVGSILNEAAAHGYQNRGAMNQIGGYANFLMEPSASYAEQIGRVSPWAAALYRSTPYGVAAGLGGAAGGAGYLAMRERG